MADSEPFQRIRSLFLRDDAAYGCAEVALVVLQEHWSLPDPADSSSAMALNGGIAYSGGTCGAITGAAMAVGRLAERRAADHRQAKTIARTVVQRLMSEFTAVHGSTECRDLTGYDLMKDHEAFIAAGVWRRECLRQLETAVGFVAPLGDPTVWEAEVAGIGGAPP